MKLIISLSGFLHFTLVNGVMNSSSCVMIYPSTTFAKYGSFVAVNCTTNCVNIKSQKFEISNSLRIVETSGTNWVYLNITINQWDTKVICVANFNGGQNRTESYIFAYDFPEKVILEPLHEVQVNKAYNLTCTVPNVGPVQNLTIKILKGNETVHNITYSDDNKKELQNKTVFYTFTPQISEISNDGINYTCSAELDLRPINIKHHAESSVNLKVYAFPENVKINVSKVIEANENTTAKCEIFNVYPTEDLKVQLQLNGTELTPTLSTATHYVLAEARFSIQRGEVNLTCKVTFRNVSTEKQEKVTTYVLPKPIIFLHEVYAGSQANITCSVTGEKPEGVNITLKRNNQSLHLKDGQHIFNAEAQDNGNNYTCETEISINGQKFKKREYGILKVKSIPWKLIFGLSGCIIPLVITFIICRHLNKKKKLGSYSVMKAFLPTSKTTDNTRKKDKNHHKTHSELPLVAS